MINSQKQQKMQNANTYQQVQSFLTQNQSQDSLDELQEGGDDAEPPKATVKHETTIVSKKSQNINEIDDFKKYDPPQIAENPASR